MSANFGSWPMQLRTGWGWGWGWFVAWSEWGGCNWRKIILKQVKTHDDPNYPHDSRVIPIYGDEAKPTGLHQKKLRMIEHPLNP
jgi:hypothetical protein